MNLSTISMPPKHDRALYCHPDNAKLLAREFGVSSPSSLSLVGMFAGINIQTSEFIPKFHRRWVPPKGRFWECEQSDRDWCEKIGWGHWEDTTDPVFYMIDQKPIWDCYTTPMINFFG